MLFPIAPNESFCTETPDDIGEEPAVFHIQELAHNLLSQVKKEMGPTVIRSGEPTIEWGPGAQGHFEFFLGELEGAIRSGTFLDAIRAAGRKKDDELVSGLETEAEGTLRGMAFVTTRNILAWSIRKGLEIARPQIAVPHNQLYLRLPGGLAAIDEQCDEEVVFIPPSDERPSLRDYLEDELINELFSDEISEITGRADAEPLSEYSVRSDVACAVIRDLQWMRSRASRSCDNAAGIGAYHFDPAPLAPDFIYLVSAKATRALRACQVIPATTNPTNTFRGGTHDD